jgi:hypothetical protein
LLAGNTSNINTRRVVLPLLEHRQEQPVPWFHVEERGIAERYGTTALRNSKPAMTAVTFLWGKVGHQNPRVMSGPVYITKSKVDQSDSAVWCGEDKAWDIF